MAGSHKIKGETNTKQIREDYNTFLNNTPARENIGEIRRFIMMKL